MHRTPQCHPLCANKNVPKETNQGSLGVTVLSGGAARGQEVLPGGTASPFREQSEAFGKQGAALLSTEKRVILFSLQKYNWVFWNSCVPTETNSQIGV